MRRSWIDPLHYIDDGEGQFVSWLRDQIGRFPSFAEEICDRGHIRVISR
jgi:hypothetical protein